MSDLIDAKAKEQGYFDVVRKLAAWTVGGIVGSGTLARVWSELGIGRAVSEKIQHVLGLDHGAAPGAAGVKGARVISEAPLTKGFGGGPPMVEEQPPALATGAEVPESMKELIKDPTATIESGSSIWRTTRDLYMQNPQRFEYSPDDPKIGRLFQSFKSQGILDRLGIDADSFADLSDEDKLKIWAENKTANSILKSGDIPKIVHAEDTVTLKPDGTIIFNETSGMKAGYLHHEVPQGTGAGRAAAETYVGKGGGVDTSQYDQAIEAARVQGATAGAWGESEVARLGAEARALEEQAIFEATGANSGLLNMWMEKGNLGGFRPETPAREVWEGVRGLSPDIVSDQPLPPTAEAMAQRGNVIRFTQEMFRRWPIQGNEEMRDYLARMSRDAYPFFNIIKKKYNL